MSGTAGRITPEVLVVAVYSALIALPFAALITLISTVGVPLIVGLMAGIWWLALARGRERISLLRGAAIGALVGVTFHMVYSVAYGFYAFLAEPAEMGLRDALGAGLKMGVVTTVFGSIISIPVGIIAFVLYVWLIRPRFFPA